MAICFQSTTFVIVVLEPVFSDKPFMDLFMNVENTISVKDRVHKMLVDANLRGCYTKDSSAFPAGLHTLGDRITRNIEARIFSEINETAIRETIKAKGFPLSEELTGSMGALGRTFDAYTTDTPHFHSANRSFEQGIDKSFIKAENTITEGKKVLEWAKYDSSFILDDIDDRTRRCIYVSGCTNARM